jgi:hypothetical protein
MRHHAEQSPQNARAAIAKTQKSGSRLSGYMRGSKEAIKFLAVQHLYSNRRLVDHTPIYASPSYANNVLICRMKYVRREHGARSLRRAWHHRVK